MKQPENQPWEVLESEYLAQKPWFTVRHVRYRLPNGNIIPDYYIFEYPTWVNVIAITKEGKFLFVSQYRPGLGETGYEIVAGVSEPDDPSPEASARRELLEETGYGGGSWRQLMVLSANPGSQNNLNYTFVATDVEPVADQRLDEGETLQVHLLDRAEVAELLTGDQIRQAMMAAPLWRYFHENDLF